MRSHRPEYRFRRSLRVRRLALVSLALLCADALANGLYLGGRVPFYVQRPSTDLLLSAKLDESTNETPESKRSHERLVQRLQFNVATRGFIYHPALVIFNLKLRPDLRWQDEEAGGVTSDGKRKFLNYSIRTTWLKDKPYTLTLGAVRSRSDVSSLLATQTDNESRNFSGALQLKSQKLPTSISFDTSDSESSGYLPASNSIAAWRLYSRNVSGDRETEFEFAQQERERRVLSTLSRVERVTVDLTNRYKRNGTLNLFSRALFSDSQSDDLSGTRYRVSSRLKLWHKHNLTSNLSAAYNHRQNNGFSSEATNFSAGLTHLLYENLTTNLTVQSTNSDTEAGEVLSYGGGIGLNYTRRTPWGQIRLYHNQNRGTRDDRRDANLIRVDDAPYTFEGVVTSIVLDDVNIDTASIIVTDAAGLIVYLPGIDYEIDTLGLTTTITRNALGDIEDDAVVLVSYNYVANPPAKTETSRRGSGIQLSLWDKIELFYNESRYDERFIRGVRPQFPLDSSSRSSGINIRLGPSLTRFQVAVLESQRAPRKTTAISETLSFTLGNRFSVGLGVDYMEMELTDTGEITEGYGANASIAWGLGRFGRLKIATFARRSESTVREQERTGLTAEYIWRFGAWRSRLYVAADDTENTFVDTAWSRQSIFIETRRRFR